MRAIPQGLRYMVAAAFFFSLMSLFVKLAGRRLPASEIVFVRSVIGVLITYALVRRAGIPLWGQHKSLLLLRGAVGFCGLLTYFFAVTRLSLADVTAIFFTNPALTALSAAVVLKERMARNEILGLVLSLGGVVLVAQPSFLFGADALGLDALGVAAALAAAVFSGVAYTMVRKLRETDHALTVMFYYPLLATPLSIPVMLPAAVWPTASEWLVLAGVGVVTQVAHYFMTKGLHTERAGRAMSMSYVQIVFAVVWGFLAFGELPALTGIAGALCIVGGSLLVVGRQSSV